MPAKPEKLLPPLELEAMKSLWALGKGTVSDVQQRMGRTRELAYTTVMTLLDRLAKKGVVSRRKQSRSYVYKPVLERQDALELALDRLVYDFFNDSRQDLRAHLLGTHLPGADAPGADQETGSPPAFRDRPADEDESLDSVLL
jgi:predicted transcriptional regulator